MSQYLGRDGARPSSRAPISVIPSAVEGSRHVS